MADAHQLLVLSNLESLNAGMIQAGADKYQRLITLRQNADFQLRSLRNSIYTLDKIESPFNAKIEQEKKNTISEKNFKAVTSVSLIKKKK